MAQTLTGGCLCGAVRYTVSADLIFSGKCYCEDCRRGGTSGHNSVYAVPEPSVNVTGKLTEFTKNGGSGQPITRRFCPVCGSKIATTAAAMPGVTLLCLEPRRPREVRVADEHLHVARAELGPPAGRCAVVSGDAATGLRDVPRGDGFIFLRAKWTDLFYGGESAEK